MQKLAYLLICTQVFFMACSEKDSHLEAFNVFCEMVASDAKPLALHYPMESVDVDRWWSEYIQVAEQYQVQLHREENFPVSRLFPGDVTAGKTVIIIYKGPRLVQYQQLKEDLLNTEGGKDNEELARRFGRLLGYSPQGINQLLSKNSDFRTLASFGVTAQITHLYYKDLNFAVEFYTNIMGLTKTDSNRFQISKDALIELHAINEVHPADQPKSVAIALLTDQLADWYAYAQENNIPIKYTYKPKEGGPHDGFVAIDPGGYLLEFEQFKQHPENELFMAALAQTEPVETAINQMNFYGSITWTYHKDLLKMQRFYEEVLGYQLVADQGWTKIYQTSNSGFIGLVDERRGMEDYADSKAVEIEWNIDSHTTFDTYAQQVWQVFQYENNSLIGPEKYNYIITD